MNLRAVYCTRSCFVSSARWLVIATAILYVLHFTQLLFYTQQGRHRNLFANNFEFNRSRCCVGREWVADVCGRSNCTEDCPDPIELPIDTEKQNAFFLETSGSGSLNIRQACAVESLAFHNPKLTINVLFMDDGRKKINRSKVIVKSVEKLKEKYNNIRFLVVNLDDYLAGTLLEKWYHCTNWRKGPYHVSHLSDGLRFLTVHKYGGYYFDLDVLIVKPVIKYRNFVASPSDYSIASNSIHADFKSPLMEMAIRNFVSNYRSDIWAHNGPALLLRILKTWCNTNDVPSMTYIRCQGFHVLNKLSFNPIHFEYWKQLFAKRPPTETGKPNWLTDQVVGVHICNKLSFNEPVYKNSTQEYNRLARDHCPKIYSVAPAIY